MSSFGYTIPYSSKNKDVQEILERRQKGKKDKEKLSDFVNDAIRFYDKYKDNIEEIIEKNKKNEEMFELTKQIEDIVMEQIDRRFISIIASIQSLKIDNSLNNTSSISSPVNINKDTHKLSFSELEQTNDEDFDLEDD